MIKTINDITSFKWATVRGTDPLSIQLDGDTEPLALIPDSLLDPLTLRVLDRVRVELSLRKVVIHGKANGAGSGDAGRVAITTSATAGLVPSGLTYERRSGWVFVTGRINRTTTVGPVATLQPGFRPESTVYYLAQGAATPRAELTVTPEGILSVMNNGGSGDIVFSFSYPIAPTP